MTDGKQGEKKQGAIQYARDVLRDKVEGILRDAKIKFISVRISRTENEVTQLGQHESAAVMSSLFELPGVFGFDDQPEDGTEVNVRFQEDGFGNVTRTVNTFSRLHAAPLYPELRAAEQAKDETEASSEEEEDEDEDPDGISDLKTKEANELLEAHGLNPTDFKTLTEKRDALKKVIYINA